MEDLERYLVEFIEPTVVDFEKNSTSIRHAFLACVVTFHAVDYLAHPRKPAPLRQEWNKRSKAFSIVDDVAHAFKHVKAGNPRSPDLRSDQVVAMSGAFARSAFQPDAFHVGRVTLADDPTVDLLTIVQDAVCFIKQQLK